GDGPSVGEYRIDPRPSGPRETLPCPFGVSGARGLDDARRLQYRRLPDPDPRDEGTLAGDAGSAWAKGHAQGVADPGPHLQGGIGTRGLEAGHHRALRNAQGVSDLPLVG